MLAHLPGEQVERYRGGAHERHLGVPDDLGECLRNVPGRRLDDVVARADRARDLFLVDALVVAGILEGDGEGTELVVGLRLSERGYQARIEPPGEVRADRDVRPQTQAHAVAQELL